MSQYAKYADYVLTGRVAEEAPTADGGSGNQTESAAPEVDGSTVPRCSCLGAGGPLRQCRLHSAASGCNKPNRQHKWAAPEVAGTLRPSSSGETVSRTSLLGRPLKVETHHRDLRYRKKQNIIYNFLERPRGWRAAFYHFIL